jgi:hypothetical protein
VYKEAIGAYLKVFPQHLPGGTEDNHEKLQHKQSPFQQRRNGMSLWG